MENHNELSLHLVLEQPESRHRRHGCREDVEQQELPPLLVAVVQMVQLRGKTVGGLREKGSDAVVCLGIYPTELETQVNAKAYTRLFLAGVLFVIART